jgi:hypothetical protein
MSQGRNRPLKDKARILVDADLLGTTKAAKHHNVPRSTIKRIRDAVPNNPDLQRLATAQRARIPELGTHTKDVLEACTDFIRRASLEGDVQNPEMVHAVTAAFKTISDARRADRALEAYLTAVRVGTRNTPDGKEVERE